MTYQGTLMSSPPMSAADLHQLYSYVSWGYYAQRDLAFIKELYSQAELDIAALDENGQDYRRAYAAYCRITDRLTAPVARRIVAHSSVSMLVIRRDQPDSPAMMDPAYEPSEIGTFSLESGAAPLVVIHNFDGEPQRGMLAKWISREPGSWKINQDHGEGRLGAERQYVMLHDPADCVVTGTGYRDPDDNRLSANINAMSLAWLNAAYCGGYPSSTPDECCIPDFSLAGTRISLLRGLAVNVKEKQRDAIAEHKLKETSNTDNTVGRQLQLLENFADLLELCIAKVPYKV